MSIPFPVTPLSGKPLITSGFVSVVGTDDAGAVKQFDATPLTALGTPGTAKSFATRSARLNLGLNGGGAVFAIGRNVNNAGAEYSGLQVGGGYAPDGTDGVILAPDGAPSWMRVQPSKNLSPIEFLVYPTMAQGFGSVVLGGNQITFVSGTAFTGFAIGKKIYIDETIYLISANTGTVITVTTAGGGVVSFAATATLVFHYGYISGSGTCSISGSTVTRIAGDPFIAFTTIASFVFKTGGTVRTVSSYTDPDTYVLSAPPGNTASVSYNFEVDINDQIATFRLQKLVGSSEENISLYARYDGYWIASQYAGSGEYRKIILTSGEYSAGNQYRQIVVQKNGDLSLGGDYPRDGLRVLAPPANPVNGIHTQAAATGVAPSFRARGADANIGLGFDTKGTGSVVLTQDFTRTLAIFNAAASAVNYFEFSGSAAGTSPFFQAKGGDTNIDLALVPKGTGVVKFGAWTSNADAPVNGYVSIKDSSGNVRKLATIA